MKTLNILLVCALMGLITLPLDAATRKKAGLHLFCWSEYVPQEVIDGFTKETGIKVSVENYDSNEVMMAKLLAGGAKYDLIQPSEYAVEALIKAGQLEELNMANIPNIKNLAPEFTKMPHDPEGKFSVPWMTGSVGIVVNTAKVKTPVTGYNDLFNGTHNKRIVVLKDSREIVSWALSSLDHSVNDITPETLDLCKPVLKKWLPQVKVYESDSPKTPLLNGDVDLGIVWSGEAAILYNKNKKFKYILPSEHAHRFIDSLAIPKGAENKENAEKFINYILRPEVSVKISQAFPYTNPNAEARKLLTKAQLENPASYPPGDPKLETFSDIGKVAKDIDKLVTDLKGR
jgi:spermidine/putrescine transport system substrate-binding protein